MQNRVSLLSTDPVDIAAPEMARISSLAYKSENTELIEFARSQGYELTIFNTKYKRAIVLANNSRIIVAHEGSSLFDSSAYRHNLNHTLTKHPIGGYVHNGIYNQIRVPIVNADTIDSSTPLIEAVHSEILRQIKEHPSADITFTGHSSGGACAVLQAAHLAHNAPKQAKRVDYIITFGQPRVGSPDFIKAFEKSIPVRKYHRYRLPKDLIPFMPPEYKIKIPLYEHGGIKHKLDAPIEDPEAPDPWLGLGTTIANIRNTHRIKAYEAACLELLGIGVTDYFNMILQPRYYAVDKIVNHGMIVDPSLSTIQK